MEGRRTWDRLTGLELEIGRVDVEPFEQLNPGGFRRLTTVVRLEGGGETGRGEDVSYTARDQEALRRACGGLSLAGRHTLASFSARLDALELWPEPPAQAAHRDYRRWAFESAALDLALAQAGTSLAARLRREPRPVSFVASTGLGSPPSVAPLEELAERVPDLRFKLDTSNDWDDDVVERLAALDRVDIVDFKGHYSGTPVDQALDPELYARVIRGLPGVWLEDPALDERVLPLLDDDWERVTWDAPIHRVADVLDLPVRPRMLNVKPSRSGRLEDLFALYDWCEAEGVAMYGGGQFELDCGRGHIQYLASLFHPGSANDVAPRAYNRVPRPGVLPPSPLSVRVPPSGFRL